MHFVITKFYPLLIYWTLGFHYSYIWENLSSIYDPEKYWSEVAKRIKRRRDNPTVAGDDSPYYQYKREKFLELFRTIDFEHKSVLEFGSGPGGNLRELISLNPSKIVGVDISAKMVELAKSHIDHHKVEIIKIDGEHLPFPDKSFDIVFTATVLQHNTDEEMVKVIVPELCDMCREQLILFERVEENKKGDELCMGRPVSFYEELCNASGFYLEKTKFINIQASFLASGVIRKIFSPNHKEGKKMNDLTVRLQESVLPITTMLDPFIPSDRDLAMMVFRPKK